MIDEHTKKEPTIIFWDEKKTVKKEYIQNMISQTAEKIECSIPCIF